MELMDKVCSANEGDFIVFSTGYQMKISSMYFDSESVKITAKGEPWKDGSDDIRTFVYNKEKNTFECAGNLYKLDDFEILKFNDEEGFSLGYPERKGEKYTLVKGTMQPAPPTLNPKSYFVFKFATNFIEAGNILHELKKHFTFDEVYFTPDKITLDTTTVLIDGNCYMAMRNRIVPIEESDILGL